MEGSGVGSAGWVVLGVQCMLMCMGSEICCGRLQYSCYTEHGRYGLCRNCGVHEKCWVCMVCWSGLCCEILLVQNMPDIK